jgi:UDP-2,3-diacylglucosamine hydrolase
MCHSLFISDLHLCESRPHITKSFIQFLEDKATQAESLYILGDLFEYWAGDDAINMGKHADIIDALKKLTSQNVRVYFIHGNRDFLIGKDFADATGINILKDPSLVTLYGKPVLLSHGDALCTDDLAYQKFRTEVRTQKWKAQFLDQPLSSRVATIEALRAKSEQEKSAKPMQIMDVNNIAVENLYAEYYWPPLFIHGHTHRPNMHTYQLNGHTCQRWVLGDWYEQGSYLKLDENSCEAQTL